MDKMLENIIGLLKQNQISNDKFSNDLGLHRGVVSEWKNGKSKSYTKISAQIASYFGVSTDFLTGLIDINDEVKFQAVRELKFNGAEFVDVANNTITTPLIPVIGSVTAGYNGIAYSEIEGYEPSGVANPSAHFWLRIKGESMSPFYLEGDLVLVHVQEDVDSGDTAVVVIDGECGTVKKLVKKEGAILLQPYNKDYEVLMFSGPELDNIRVVGKVVELRRR